MRLTVFLLLFSLLLSPETEAQYKYPYKLSTNREIPISLVGLGSLGGAFLLHRKKQALSEEDILQLDPMSIRRFDRSATLNWSPKAALASDVLLFASIVAPASLLGSKRTREEWLTYGVMAVESFVLITGITNLTKEIAERKRPYMYNPNAPMHEKQKKDATSSFFSGHTSVTAGSLFFLAKSFNDFYPSSSYKPVIWGLSAGIPALVAYLRYRAGKHFLSDVIVGYIAGALVGTLVPIIHQQ